MENELATVLAGAGVAVTLLTTMVIGATELVKRLFDRDYRAAALITVAAVVGGLGGALMFETIGLALGLVIGLSASGIITGIQKFGTGTTSAPSDLSR